MQGKTDNLQEFYCHNPYGKNALLPTIFANSWQIFGEYTVDNPFMADQHSPNIRKMFTFHMQIRFAANT